MNLTKINWPKGWIPSQDDVNGSPDGLLRMDNLRQNEEGVLTLVRGAQKLNSSAFGDYVSKIFSKIINSVEYLWVALNDATTSVLRSGNNFGSSTSVLSSGGNKACFGDALGQVLICAGSQRKKDNGTTVLDLGIITPLAPPSIVVHFPPRNFTGPALLGHWDGVGDSAITEQDGGAFITSQPSSAILEAFFPSPTDLFNITGDGPSTNPGTDVVQFNFQPEDPQLIVSIRLKIFLDATNLGDNYYYHDFIVQNNGQFPQAGTNVESSIFTTRDQFVKAGSDPTKDWTTVVGIQYIIVTTGETVVFCTAIRVIGGALGQLNGTYEWAQQDVNDNGTYVAKSPLSPSTTSVGILAQNTYVTVTPNPTTDPQVNYHWIYRRSIPSTVPIAVNENPIPDLLDHWYRVAVTPVNTPVDDTLDDISAITDEDSTTVVDEYLQSLRDTDDVIGMEGIYNERMLYLTKDQILLSDRLNPDAVDIRFSIKAFGDPTEKNLFLKKITNNQLVLATTKDLYEINGTLLDLPDGSLDISILAIGEKYPPLSADFAINDGRLYYVAADGVRVTAGSNSYGIGFAPYQSTATSQLALLFQGEDRFGVPSIGVTADNQVSYPMTIGHGNLYASIQLRDLTRRLFVYNFLSDTYRLQTSSPLALWATQTDRLLFGYGGGDNYLREFEKGTNIDGAGGQSIFLQTIYDANQQPRNRKDTFTLKIIADTGGADVTVALAKDKGNFVTLGTINNNGEKTFYFDVDVYKLGFRYAVQLQGAALNTFFIYEMTLEYDPRPEQVNYLHIPNTNQGSYARKRWTSFAFVVDTLGNDVTFTPYIDNSAGTPSTCNRATKLTYIHFFTSETIGTDTGGILQSPSGQPFEFYGVNLEETVSEKLPTPTEYLVIPANDYGTPNRKRFTSYKFQINTRGANVQLTPRVDGTNYATAIFNTSEKRTVEYFFDTSIDVTGIDIGGILQTLASTPFEFYGVITPQQVEQLPPRLESLYTPNTNYGVAARKRLRTIPIIINTNGSNVIFTPVVDGTPGTPTTLNSNRRQTLYHYFATDVFCTDLAGIFTGSNPFEFYEFGQPEGVETLPVPKKYDQLQPLRLDKIGKLFGFRLRIIPVDDVISYTIYSEAGVVLPAYDATPLYSGTITVVPDVDDVYEVQFPKSLNTDLIRIVLGPTTNPFHRYDLTVKVSMSGTETDSQWIPLK